MATRVTLPSSVKTATWYTQYQETNVSINGILPKKFGITKRTAGIPATSLTSGGKATNIRAQYQDVVGTLPKSQLWNTLRIPEVNGIRAVVSKPINTTINNGQTYTDEITGTAAQINDIPAGYNHSGISSNGNTTGWEFYGNGFNINISIPSNGTVRFQITNNTGGNVTLSGKYIFADIFKSKQEIADFVGAIYADKDSPTFAEFAENGMPYNKVEETFEAIYNKIKNDSGGTVNSPADTELYADYFAGLNGGAPSDNFNTTNKSLNELRNQLASEANARANVGYYTNGWYNYRNRLISGYFNGIPIMLNGANVYSTIYDIEREFVAHSGRKVGVFGWGSFEGIGQALDGAMWQSLPLETAELIRLVRAQGSFEMTQMQAFISVLIGNTYVMWNDNAQYGTDIKCWDKAYIGGADTWKTIIKPYGGTESTWQQGNPSQPQPICSPGQSPFSDSAAPNLNGAFAGVYLYQQIKNRSNTKIKYATFSFTKDGVSTNGYNGTNFPVMGSKGDGSVSIFGNSNYGQYNIVNQWEVKKPIVWECIGTSGTAIVIINLYAGIAENVTYTITTQNHGVQTISHTGQGLGVYTI